MGGSDEEESTSMPSTVNANLEGAEESRVATVHAESVAKAPSPAVDPDSNSQTKTQSTAIQEDLSEKKPSAQDETLAQSSAAREVSARAEMVASDLPPNPCLQLDEIWQRDLESINLPEYVRAHSTTMGFPEKLMLLLIHVERSMHKAGKRSSAGPIAWILDGRAFVIQDRDQLVQQWLPKFFLRGKFQSFTRKLYRWEFRQVNLPREGDTDQDSNKELYFAHPYFQRDRKQLMMYMRSVTAARTRRQQQQQQDKRKPPPPGLAPPALEMAPTAAALQALGSRMLRPATLSLPQGPQTSLDTMNPYSNYLSTLGQQQNPVAQLEAAQNLARSNQQISQLATTLGLLQANPQLHQNLLLSSLLGNMSSPSLSPPALANPFVPGRSLLGQTSGEMKNANDNNEAEQERLRQAAEILLRALNSRRNDGSSSSQK